MGLPTYTWSHAWTAAIVASLERLGCLIEADTNAAGQSFKDGMEALVIKLGEQCVVLGMYKTSPHMHITCDYFACLYCPRSSRALCALVDNVLLACGAKAFRRPIGSKKLYTSTSPNWGSICAALSTLHLSLIWTETSPSGLRIGTISSSVQRCVAPSVHVSSAPIVDVADFSERWFVALQYGRSIAHWRLCNYDKLVAHIDSAIRQSGMHRVETVVPPRRQ